MCGRYALDQNAASLASHFALLGVPALAPRYNIAPGTPVLVVHETPAGRIASPMLWGFQPGWARHAAPTGVARPRPINARAETAATNAMFRGAFRHHRCLFPASGFYEWQRLRDEKQPWYIHPAHAEFFAFAGLFDPGSDDAPPTCCILTTTANAAMARVHDRMPVIVVPEHYATWLAADTPLRSLAPLLGPCDSDAIALHPVGRAVNSPRNEGAGLVVPMHAIDAGPDVP